MTRNEEVVSLLFDSDPQTAEGLRDDTEVGDAYVRDAQLRIGHSCHADEATDLNHVGEHGVLCTVEFLYSFDGEAVRSNTFDVGTHTYQ